MKSSNKLMALGIVFSIAVLIVIGTIAYSIINDKKDKGNEMFAYSTQQSLGKDDAPVKVVEFGDFKMSRLSYLGCNSIATIKRRVY